MCLVLYGFARYVWMIRMSANEKSNALPEWCRELLHIIEKEEGSQYEKKEKENNDRNNGA